MKWLFLFLIPFTAFAKVKTEKIEYIKNGQRMQGVLAYNTNYKAPRPGVVVFADWMGIGPYSIMRAQQLAELGYVAFAADVYGVNQNPVDQKAAAELAGKFRADNALMRERAEAALEVLTKSNLVNKNKLGAMGFCFGGTLALELARDGAPLKGVVSFHGGLATNKKATTMGPQILILHGADDPFVPEKDVMGFQQEMREAKADWQFIAYGNTVHSFTQENAGNDNSKGAAYNAESTARAMEQMKLFFKKVFK